MALTSMVIPPLAIGHYLRGWLRHRAAQPRATRRCAEGQIALPEAHEAAGPAEDRA
jgi:hypothetical protein